MISTMATACRSACGDGVEQRSYLHRVQTRLQHRQADTPRPEHRIVLAPVVGRVEQLLVSGGQPTLLGALDAQLLDGREELVERRIEQPHRHRQPVHRLQDLLRSRPAAPPGAVRAPFASWAGVDARIIARTTGSRSGARNMCSVRHSPIPSAPSERAIAASSPVSAFARTPSFPFRIESAHARTVSNSGGGSAGSSSNRPRHDVTTVTVDRQPVALVHDGGADPEPLAVDVDRLGADDGRVSPSRERRPRRD